jgi:hypothetical protein
MKNNVHIATLPRPEARSQRLHGAVRSLGHYRIISQYLPLSIAPIIRIIG